MNILDKFSNYYSSLPIHKKLFIKIILFLLNIIVFSIILTIFTNINDWSTEQKFLLNEMTNKNENIKKYFKHMINYSFDVFSTVGFGYLIPITNKSRYITNFMMISAVCILIF
jgi:hypothetical protein